MTTAPKALPALPDHPPADKYVDCGEVRPLPMYHLSTLLQFGEKCQQAIADHLASAGGVEDAYYKRRWDQAVSSAKSWHLVDAARFKLSLNSRGRPTNTFPEELDGRWVAFQHAEDDAHVPLSLMLDQANAARSKEREVAQALRDTLRTFIEETMCEDWSDESDEAVHQRALEWCTRWHAMKSDLARERELADGLADALDLAVREMRATRSACGSGLVTDSAIEKAIAALTAHRGSRSEG